MKIKDVSLMTGLTKKTIRFYESEGLLAPQKTMQNGREFREYSEGDVQRLLDIATLRRARFTVDEIKRMQETPGDTRDIFLEYRNRLHQEQRELRKILTLVDRIPEETLTSDKSLVSQIETAAKELPLPRVDVHPHFKYLDDLEAMYTKKKQPKLTPQEIEQRKLAAKNAAWYAGFSTQNKAGDNLAAGGRGIGDISNAQKIAAYNLLMNSKDE